jgi:DNA-binding PadR family transcriptional regulator
MVVSTAKPHRAAAEPIELSAPVTPAVFHILLALADGESHGYGIMQEVELFTKGDKQLGPGTLYRSIQRMLVDGLIQELSIALHGESDDDRRRYYRLTAKGLVVARAEAQRLADLVDAARRRGLLAKRPGQERGNDQSGTGGLSHHHAAARRQRGGRRDRVVHKGARRK